VDACPIRLRFFHLSSNPLTLRYLKMANTTKADERPVHISSVIITVE
jgi:hypothetical protein